SAEKKPDPPKVDPIAEALKKEEKKPPKPQVQAAAPPQPTKPKAERTFDQTKIAALLDKRDPTRQAAAGDTLNSNAALGLANGKAADNSATWGALFKEQVLRCWKKPYGGIEAQRVRPNSVSSSRRMARWKRCRLRRRRQPARSSACSRRAGCARSSNARRTG